jgi:hypothetical protein
MNIKLSAMQKVMICLILLLTGYHYRKNLKPSGKQLKINFDEDVNHEEDWDEFGLVSRLSIEEFRKFPGCEHYTDGESKSIIDSLYRLGIIGYNSFGSQTEQSIFIVDKY